MKRKYTVAGLLVAACIVLLTGCLPGQPEATPDEVTPTVVLDRFEVVAEAVIEPARRGELRFEIRGDAVGVLVEEGDTVAAGDVLIRLDPSDLERAVARAELGVRQAEVSLIQAETGVRQAETGTRQAELRLGQLLEPPKEAAVEAAEAAVADAQFAYQEAKMNQSIVVHALSVGKDVEAARYARDEAYRRYQNLVERKGAGDTVTEGARIAYLDALGTYNRVVETSDFERAAADNAVERARLAVQVAQSGLDQLLEGPSEKDIESAEVGIELARQEAEQARTNVEAAQAGIASAQLSLDVALSDLEKAALVAPFAGTIVTLGIDPGDDVSAGQVAIVLATLDHLRAVTIDMTELDVAQVVEGQEVIVSVDAIPGAEIRGVVDQIGLQAQRYQGDVVYPVYVELNTALDGLRWGMTAVVTVPTE